MSVMSIDRKKLALTALIGLISSNAYAAVVDGSVKYIDSDYGTDYSYTGYKVEFDISPEQSKFYFPLEAREYNHQSGQEYERLGAGVGYKFAIGNGQITPEIKLRRETYFYAESELNVDWLVTKTTYDYDLLPWLKFTGRFDLGVIKNKQIKDNAEIIPKPNKPGENIAVPYKTSDDFYQYFTEIRPALRFLPFKEIDYFNKSSLENSRIDVFYYYLYNRSFRGGVEANNGGNFEADNDKNVQQIRIETNFDLGKLKLGPYVRLPLGSNREHSGAPMYEYQSTRFGVKFAYPINSSISLVGEYYRDEKEIDKEYLSEKLTDGKSETVEVGITFKF